MSAVVILGSPYCTCAQMILENAIKESTLRAKISTLCATIARKQNKPRSSGGDHRGKVVLEDSDENRKNTEDWGRGPSPLPNS